MEKKFKTLSDELTARFLTLYRKVLLDQKDTRGNQILSPEQADSIISQMDAEDIKSHYSEHEIVLDVYADVATRPYRTFYPEDVESFRKEYLEALNIKLQPWEKDTADYLRSQFETRYTDDAIVRLLKEACTPLYAIAQDFMSF